MTRPFDADRFMDATEDNVASAAARLVIERIDSGMDPLEATKSVRRWGDRLAARVRRGVEYGSRGWSE